MKKSGCISLGCILVMVLTGCLTVETMSVTILFDEQRKATLVLEYEDISSDEKTATGLKEDFGSLIQALESPEYIKERSDEGLDLLERKLEVRDSRIVGHEKAEAKGTAFLTETLKLSLSETEMRLVLDSADEELIETNARTLKENQTTVLTWPVSEKRLYYKVRLKTRSDQAAQNRPEMVRLVQAHLTGSKVQDKDHGQTDTNSH
ncbi:hypothetical protein JXQ70_20815 [bacterium]|nr:hypothetical protein [bacterium]